MKILIISDNLKKGGKERRLFELLRFIDINASDLKIELILLNKEVHYQSVFSLKNVKVTVISRKIKKDPSVFFKIWNFCQTFKPDIIHTWGSMPAIYAIPSAFSKNIPLLNAMIANSKCKPFGAEWLRFKITYPFSKVVLANSKAGLKAFNVNKKGQVIYNGFNFDRISNLINKEEVKRKYGIKTKYLIGMVAAFHHRKDYSTFLETAKEIITERNDITFIAVGDGENRLPYMERYRDLDNIIFTGIINDVEQLMNCFDIGALLTNSEKHLEGISNSILEMMALRIPVIASRGGGTDEIVEHNRTGILIDSLSKDQFKDKVLLLIENSNLRQELGNNAGESIRDKFSIEQMCFKTLELYKLLDNK